jgi:GT2 family glycosyltransferase
MRCLQLPAKILPFRPQAEIFHAMTQPPLIAVVIVNFNGYEMTRACLRSFRRVTYRNYVLIVVDNASNDNSVQKLKKEFPHAYYMASTFNTGFTGGNNMGLKRAEELDAKYVFFLNNDTIVSENILDELILFSSRHPEVGIVGPLTYYFETEDTISFGGAEINRNTGTYIQFNKNKTLSQLEDKVIYCSFIEGAAMFMCTALAVEAGGFSDVYFLTSEESELCVRVADKGYKLAVITSCSVWHKISRTLEGGSALRNYFTFRNRLLFVKRNAIGFGVKDLFELAWFYGKSFAWCVFKGRNLPAAKGVFLGTLDFFSGATGPGRYAKILNARHRREAIS